MRSTFKFKLYVADDAPNSLQAGHLPDRQQIKIVEMFREPKHGVDKI